ncbi:MAG: SBBP repeat-containing protein [Bryobacteraceae bacterium]
MLRSVCRFLPIVFVAATLSAVEPRFSATPVLLPLVFEPNQGQAAGDARFIGRNGRLTLRFLPSRVEFLSKDTSHLLRMRLEGGDPRVRMEGMKRLQGLSFYYRGSNPKRWLTNIPNFALVRYRDAYPGVDMVFYGNGGQLEYDLVVAPGADVGAVRLRFDGAKKLALESSGDLRIDTPFGILWQKKPLIYQESGGVRRKVTGGYVIDGSRVRFAVEDYDRDERLVIDPTIIYATYFGGSGNDSPAGLGADAVGNVYFAGNTASADYPADPRGPTNAPHGGADTFVTKMDPTGKTILYSVILGGDKDDKARAISVDPSGNAYITGYTHSVDYPVKNAYQASYNGDDDTVFVTKLDPAGSIVYSTFFGGSSWEYGDAIVADVKGNAYVAGHTWWSKDFPITVGDLTSSHGWGEAFVAGFDPTGNLLFSALIGGNDADDPAAITMDSSGMLYVAGETYSTNLSTTPGAIQSSCNRCRSPSGDAWIAKINPLASRADFILALTYLGGSGYDFATAIQADSSGNVYVAGTTHSTDFPVTAGAYQTQNGGLSEDAWIAKLDSKLTRKLYSTYVGWSAAEGASGLAVDADGSAWIAGYTGTRVLTPAGLGTRSDTLQPEHGGGSEDAFLFQLNPAGTAALYFTYLGGRGEDSAMDLTSDSAGNFYLLLRTDSANMPYVQQALQPTPAGGVDIYLLKVVLSPQISVGGFCNAASYECGKVAAGEILAVFGSGFGSSSLVPLQVVNDRLTTSLGDTKIFFDGTAAPMIYVLGGSSSVLSCVVPYGVAGKSSTRVQVEYKGQKGNTVTVPVVAAAPGVFSMNQSGTGPGAILNSPDYSVNSASSPAPAGGYIMVFATGEGKTDVGLDGQIVPLYGPYPRPILWPWTATVGGRNAAVVWAGSAPQSIAGLFQINIQIPAALPPGVYEVVISAGGFSSQPGLTVAVN